MASFVDVCRFTAASSGTGDFVVSAAVTGYQTPAAAGAVNSAIYRYRAESADLSQWEVGFGAYTSGSTTLARTTVLYNSSGGSSAINFSAAPQVAIVALASDMLTTGATDNAALRANGTGGSSSQASALIIDDTTGRISRSGNGGISVQGTNTNDSAAAGDVGQIIESSIPSGSAVSLTTGNAANVTSISLTAGDWDVWGNVITVNSGTITIFFGAISSVSATLPTPPNGGGYTNVAGISTTSNIASTAGFMRVSLASTTTIYLIALAGFSGSVSAYGYIGARRVR